MYRTVFVAHPQLRLESLAPWVSIAAATYFYYRWLAARGGGRGRLVGRQLGLIASALGGVLTAALMVATYRTCSTPLDSKSVSMVMGTVTNNRPWRPHIETETFTVEGVTFELGGAVGACYFDKPSREGGPIHNGLDVRLFYTGKGKGSRILRLDISEEEPPMSVPPVSE